MAAASGQHQAEALLKRAAPVDEEGLGDFLARVQEVNEQIQLLKAGADPDSITDVRSCGSVSNG